MRVRLFLIIPAVLLGLLTAALVVAYTSQVNKKAEHKKEMVEVLVADRALPVGLTLDELRSRTLVATKKVPREYIPDGALLVDAELKGRVLAVALEEGEELTTSKFRVPAKAGLSYATPHGMVAVAIPTDESRAVSYLVKVGDHVNVVGTVETRNGVTKTQTLLKDVVVLAVGGSLENAGDSGAVPKSRVNGAASSENAKTITLAVSQADAEKLIALQEDGRSWLTLLPPSESISPTAAGELRSQALVEGGRR